jgi:hypothetical protein
MGHNIYDIHDGGIPILKNLRKLRRDNNGGVTTYVLIMFGMIFILYLFGFTSIWGTYSAITVGANDTAISDPTIAFGVNILSSLASTLTDPETMGVVGGGLLALAGLMIFGWLTKTTATILQFLIPVLLMIALNIFIFPIGNLSTDLMFMGVGISAFIIIFFNLFYILSVIEFVRGNA